MSTSNGTTHDNGYAADEAVDLLYSYWPGQPPAPQPCPEARASVNVRLVVSGHEVQWTLRDDEEGRLAARLERLLAQYPAPGKEFPTSAPTHGQEGWCARHSVAMKLNQKNGNQWFSHRLATGDYCKGK
jgi:hypothetical protein